MFANSRLNLKELDVIYLRIFFLLSFLLHTIWYKMYILRHNKTINSENVKNWNVTKTFPVITFWFKDRYLGLNNFTKEIISWFWLKIGFGTFFLNFIKVSLICLVLNFCCTARWFSYTYIYSFSNILSHYGLFNRILLFIQPVCINLHLLMSNSHPFPTLSPLVTTCLLAMSISLFLSQICFSNWANCNILTL